MSSSSSSILVPVRRRTSMPAQVQKALFSSHSGVEPRAGLVGRGDEQRGGPPVASFPAGASIPPVLDGEFLAGLRGSGRVQEEGCAVQPVLGGADELREDGDQGAGALLHPRLSVPGLLEVAADVGFADRARCGPHAGHADSAVNGSVHRLPGERPPQAEQMALHQLAPQTDRDLAEVDLGFGAGQVRLLDEHLRRATAGLDPNLRLPLGDVGAHDLVGHVVHRVLVDQPAIDPDHRVTLLPRRIQISQQHLVDHRLERIQLERRGAYGSRGCGHAELSAF
ncbi:hypothetical protein [Streptomyces sp. 2A115]|uniref:hypothetical protein n=1 Tax=Streptomyces sp. 2A115 TaxID=3457439 RepID=UPI003FCF4E45